MADEVARLVAVAREYQAQHDKGHLLLSSGCARCACELCLRFDAACTAVEQAQGEDKGHEYFVETWRRILKITGHDDPNESVVSTIEEIIFDRDRWRRALQEVIQKLWIHVSAGMLKSDAMRWNTESGGWDKPRWSPETRDALRELEQKETPHGK